MAMTAHGYDQSAPSVKGPSSSDTPYLVPIAGTGVKVVSILSAGNSVGNKKGTTTPYKMLGIPDGGGAFDNGDGTFTLLLNHEFGTNSNNQPVGAVRAHGQAGAVVSKWIINKSDLKVLDIQDFCQSANDVMLFNTATGKYVSAPTLSTNGNAFQRFCSGDLPVVSALFNKNTGLGSKERFYFAGEETGSLIGQAFNPAGGAPGVGRNFAFVITGTDAGKIFELPRLGKGSWENALCNPFAQDLTIVGEMDDSTGTSTGPNKNPFGLVCFYVGTKTANGSDVDKAGLTNGKLFGVSVTGVLNEVRADGLGVAKGTQKTFTLVKLADDATSLSGAALHTAYTTANGTQFLRPEDGAWDPKNPRVFFFHTTDQLDTRELVGGTVTGATRLWKLTFSDIANPAAGGTIEVLVDGSVDKVPGGGANEYINMLDNMGTDRFGHIMLCEDVGNAAHNGKIHQFTQSTKTIKTILKHDPARFGDVDPATGAVTLAQDGGTATNDKFSKDEESSGVFDASTVLGPGWWIVTVQAHYITADTEIQEGGQLLAFFAPDSVGNEAPVVDSTPFATPNPAGVGQTVTFTAGASDPDGDTLTYTWSFGDGTNGTGTSVTHTYAAAGVYQASVSVADARGLVTISSTVAVTVNKPLIGGGKDSDGDGFSDDIETKFGSNPNNAADTPFGGKAAPVPTAFSSLGKIAVKVSFDPKKTGKDSLSFSGILSVPSGLTLNGLKVLVDFTGETRVFTLDDKGKSTPKGNDTFMFSKPKSGNAPFKASFKNANLLASLTAAGIVNETSKGKPVTFTVNVFFNGAIYSKSVTAMFKGTKGKSGSITAK